MIGLTARLLLAVIVAGAGSGFQHGYNIGVVNTPQQVLIRWLGRVYFRSQQCIEDTESCETKNYENNVYNRPANGNVERSLNTGSKKCRKAKICECDEEDAYAKDPFVIFMWELAVSVYCIGGLIGGLMTPCFAENIGRRNGLIVNGLFAAIGGFLMSIAKLLSSPALLIVGRFFSGVNGGLNSGLCPLYLNEVSTKVLRGIIGDIYQMVMAVAILISQIMGLSHLLGNNHYWPILFGFTAIVAMIQTLLLPLLCPESPKYLYATKGEEKCKDTLVWLRKGEVEEEIAEIKSECDEENALGVTNCGQMFSEKVLRRPLIISLIIMSAQQLSGINVVTYYSTDIFKKAGCSFHGAQIATIGMGVFNILITFISLILVKLAKRKTLLVMGLGGMFIATCFPIITLGFVYKGSILPTLYVILVILILVFFGIGPGSIPRFIISEFFPPSAKLKACSLTSGVNWVANFFVGVTFLSIENEIGYRVFIIFAVLQFIFLVYIFFQVPETKNKTYEEISENFK